MRLFVLIALCAACFACKKDAQTDEEILADDIAEIKADLAQKNLTAQSTASGLHYIIATPGSSERPNINSTVTVRYKGMFLDGSVFDETTGNATATFPLANLIRGWQEAIPLLGKGGKGTFWIPSGLAYGRNGQGSIPGNTVLVFEIELVDFN